MAIFVNGHPLTPSSNQSLDIKVSIHKCSPGIWTPQSTIFCTLWEPNKPMITFSLSHACNPPQSMVLHYNPNNRITFKIFTLHLKGHLQQNRHSSTGCCSKENNQSLTHSLNIEVSHVWVFSSVPISSSLTPYLAPENFQLQMGPARKWFE